VKKTHPIYAPSQAVYSRLDVKVYSSIRSYVFGVLLVAILILLLDALSSSYGIGLIVLASAAPVAYLIWVARTDRYEPEPKWLVLGMFGWGVVSILPAGLGNSIIFELVGNEYLAATFGAPVIEESLKMLGVLWLATSKKFGGEFNNHMDGLVYGFAVGMGFAAVEDASYFARALAAGGIPALTLNVFSRQVLGGIGHGVFTGMTGRWLGLMKVRRGRVTKKDVLPGLLTAMFMHGLWNGTAETVIMPFALTVWLALILRRHLREALRDEAHWGYTEGRAPVEPR